MLYNITVIIMGAFGFLKYIQTRVLYCEWRRILQLSLCDLISFTTEFDLLKYIDTCL